MELGGKLVQQVNQSLCGCGEALANGLSPTACFLLSFTSPPPLGDWSKNNKFSFQAAEANQLASSLPLQVLSTFNDVVWHASWSITGDILAISGGDNKVGVATCVLGNCCHENRSVVINFAWTPQHTLHYMYLHAHTHVQVTLWKESPEGPWVCVSEVDKGQQTQQQ